MKLSKYFDEFDQLYGSIEYFNSDFHNDIIGVTSFASKASSACNDVLTKKQICYLV